MTDNTVDSVPRLPPANPIFEGPVLSILVRFALPNTASMTAATLVATAETPTSAASASSRWPRSHWCFPSSC